MLRVIMLPEGDDGVSTRIKGIQAYCVMQSADTKN
jgi:hypothetical protein